MIEERILKNKALKGQTSFRNITREYFQHLFLASFYKKRGSENFLFKGGTALRLVFGSPRFSEDLDFSAENLKIELLDSKPTSGGHLAILGIDLFGEKFELSEKLSALLTRQKPRDFFDLYFILRNEGLKRELERG